MAEPRRKLDLLAAPTALAGVGLWLARAALLTRLGDEPLARLWVERAPLVLLVTAALLVAAPRLIDRLIETCRLAPAADDRERKARLFLLSFSALLLELALIRWIGAEVRFFAYFKNFVLISCFLGFGIGFALGPHQRRLFPAALVGLTTLAILVSIWGDVSLYPAIASQEQTWGHSVQLRTPLKLVFMLAFFLICLVSFFFTLTGTFAALVQEMGTLFQELPRIPAYTINLVGSLAGVVAFNILSWAETGPPIWFLSGLLPLVLVLSGRLRWVWVAATAITLGLVGRLDSTQTGADVLHHWSPYYRVSLKRTKAPLADTNNRGPVRYQVSVNRRNMSTTGIVDPKLFASFYGVPMPPGTYDLPFALRPDPKRVLVLGMGMGNDLSATIRLTKPDKVVGVEIDPGIARYARLFNPENPFAHPNVEVVVDDARHYVQTTKEQFDLVLISQLDSHTLLSAYSQLRTDNFLYTRECFEKIRDRLTENGVFVLVYATDNPWVVQRLAAALRAAFGRDPLVVGQHRAILAIGPGIDPKALPESRYKAYLLSKALPQPPAAQDYPTDDRPFLTIASRWLPSTYWIAIVVVISLTAFALRQAELPVRGLDWKFGLLGAAFLLAETRLITQAGLLFGVTWHAYGIAISLVLLTLVIGTLLAGKFEPRRLGPAYLVLLGTIVLSQVLAGQLLEVEGTTLRLVLAVALFGPLFLVASFVFAGEFAKVETDRVPVVLASNLLGSVVGGLLEYQAVGLGIASLAITAGGLYLAAGVLSQRGASAPAPAE